MMNKKPFAWHHWRTPDGQIPTCSADLLLSTFVGPEAPLPKRTKNYASDELAPSAMEVQRFLTYCQQEGDHVIFQKETGVHFHVTTRYGYRTVISVARIWWKVYHPEVPFGAEDELVTTCPHKGDHSNGHERCLAHLEVRYEVDRGDTPIREGEVLSGGTHQGHREADGGGVPEAGGGRVGHLLKGGVGPGGQDSQLPVRDRSAHIHRAGHGILRRLQLQSSISH